MGRKSPISSHARTLFYEEKPNIDAMKLNFFNIILLNKFNSLNTVLNTLNIPTKKSTLDTLPRNIAWRSNNNSVYPM